MKKKIVIISTYPEHGSKNIGDQLITNKLKELLSEFGEFECKVVWRAAPWETVKETVLSADHIFFACLAMRKNMHSDEYPFLEEIINSEVPFSAIASGTQLPITERKGIFDEFSQESMRLLKAINKKAVVCTTRGYLTQEFCRRNGLDRFFFTGDIAFFNKGIDCISFVRGKKINKIAISDPHNPKLFMNSFIYLYSEVKNLFPESEITVVQHGINKQIDTYCKLNNIITKRIYEDPNQGLSIYDEIDLHIGYRVHAHVSALSRKCYSYLMEQDGRGCDYGLTINRKISIPSYSVPKAKFSPRSLAKLLLKGDGRIASNVPIGPAEQMIAMIRTDSANEFDKFSGLDHQLESFNKSLRSAIHKSLTTG